MKEWKNPFDEFPRRYGGRTTHEKMGYRSYVEYSAEDDPEKWRKKWEGDILEAYRLAQLFTELMKEMIKLGVIKDD